MSYEDLSSEKNEEQQEKLLVSVEKLDQSECEKALRDMQENSINHPTW